MNYTAKWQIVGLGQEVKAGTVIELDPESKTAKQLLAAGAIVQTTDATPPPEEIPEETTQSQLPPEVLAMSKAQLQAYALETYGLNLSSSLTKEQMLAAISAA